MLTRLLLVRSQRFHPQHDAEERQHALHPGTGAPTPLVRRQKAGTLADSGTTTQPKGFGIYRRPEIIPIFLWPCVISRIVGKTARSQDIYYSVSVQIQKNFARTKWKVSGRRFLGHGLILFRL